MDETNEVQTLKARVAELERQVEELKGYKLQAAGQELKELLDRYGVTLAPAGGLTLTHRAP